MLGLNLDSHTNTRHSFFSEIAICPCCKSELELDESEISRGQFICPVCNFFVDLRRQFRSSN